MALFSEFVLTHLVWDWNGTLLDDLQIVVESVSVSIATLGARPIRADDYRDHYTRPVRNFYVSLLGREISDEEWLRLDTAFHDEYFRRAENVDLAPDALQAMDLLDGRGWTQSLLSMSPQNWLDGIVARLGIADRFLRVDGMVKMTGGLKAAYLEDHLRHIGIPGKSTVVVGDTPDDVAAARHVGATPILFHGGSHHLEVLEGEGVPIAETLVDAVDMAFARASDASSPIEPA
ncbi:MAG TPA: HAD family hydrolase [Acidimicrobiia bacterium]|nr:HAD family hydrolase [Acidimicrobiia bacterium]